VNCFYLQKQDLLTICLNRKDGKILWQKSIFPDTLETHISISNPATNTVVTDGGRVIVYFASCGLICYNIDGEEQWKYQKPQTKNTYGNGTSPVISGDKLIYLNDEGKERYLLALDKTNGKEIWKTAFQIDSLYGGQGGHATPCIYNDIIIVHTVGEVTAYSINPESKGQLTDSAILWSVIKNTAEVPSPIYYRERVYMIKDGGFITCINPVTGNIIYQTRIGNPGAYFATPVAANGLIYLLGYNGKLTIIKAGDELKIIAQHDFRDNIAATPAIIGNSIYIRTKTGLLAFSD